MPEVYIVLWNASTAPRTLDRQFSGRYAISAAGDLQYGGFP
jgi:hypothetical protein